jgi:hypothetical protein
VPAAVGAREETMLDEKQKAALRQWYRQPKVLREARQRIENEYWEDLEEFLHMRCLLPFSRTEELPDFVKDEAGATLIPSLDPRSNEEGWQEAIEIGWKVIEDELGVSRDEVHRAIAGQQKASWEAFLASVEQRKNERQEPES